MVAEAYGFSPELPPERHTFDGNIIGGVKTAGEVLENGTVQMPEIPDPKTVVDNPTQLGTGTKLGIGAVVIIGVLALVYILFFRRK